MSKPKLDLSLDEKDVNTRFAEIQSDIYRILDTEDLTTWLDYDDNFGLDFETIPIKIEANEATLSELVALCENDDSNNQKPERVHLKLTYLLLTELGEEIATQVLGTIAKYGGLHSISGLNLKPEESVKIMQSLGMWVNTTNE